MIGRLGEDGQIRRMSGKDRKPTEFERRVYEQLMKVPRGRVTTYGGLAGMLGVASAQAVGQALRRNPYAPEVPCHRVIRSDLGIGGFDGQTKGEKLRRKLGLLEEEGVKFDAEGRLVEAERVWEG